MLQTTGSNNFSTQTSKNEKNQDILSGACGKGVSGSIENLSIMTNYLSSKNQIKLSLKSQFPKIRFCKD